MRLIDAPVGVFRFSGDLVLKTEYMVDIDGVWIPDCYILDSGEKFWGGMKSKDDFKTKYNDLEVEVIDVEPQRMRGKWNAYYHGEENGKSIFSYSCNQCGYGAPYNFIGGVCEQKKWNFCPNCGAKMEGTE